MAAPLTSNVVIECPNCGTRYQLPADTVGPKGRQVACAHCGGTWKAKPIAVPDPDSDTIFDEQAEAELDAQFDAAAAGARAEDPDREARERTLAEIRAAIDPAAPSTIPTLVTGMSISPTTLMVAWSKRFFNCFVNFFKLMLGIW